MHSSRMCTTRLLTVSQHALPGGCTCQGGVPAWGVYLPGGVPAQGVPAQVLPPVNRMTDRCKNITLPQTSFAGGNYRSSVLRFWMSLSLSDILQNPQMSQRPMCVYFTN